MDEDSKPLDFNTFVPDHDPTLTMPAPVQIPDYGSYNIPEASVPMVSQDEAFSRALQAMYWTGYYSAVYYVSLFRRDSLIDEVLLFLVPKRKSAK